MRGPTRADCVRQSDALPSRDEPHDTGAADRHGRGGAHQCTAVARRSTRVCCGAAGAGWLWRPTVVVARTETTVRVCELRDHVWAEVVAHKPRDHPLWKIKAILLHFNDWLNLKSTKFNTLTLPYSTRTRGLSLAPSLPHAVFFAPPARAVALLKKLERNAMPQRGSPPWSSSCTAFVKSQSVSNALYSSPSGC